MIELRAGDALAVVDPDGGGNLARLAIRGRELLTERGSFVMAPWAARMGDAKIEWQGESYRLEPTPGYQPHALHGTVRDRAWTVVATTDQTVRLRTDLGPMWPWPGSCEQTVTLEPDELMLALDVATGGAPFPVTAGWHPWFVKPSAVTAHAAAMLERGADHLPTGDLIVPAPKPGDRPLDDCFQGVEWPVTIDFADLGLRLAIDATGCDHVVIYDERSNTTCVEPQSGPPNAHNTASARVVTRHEPLRIETRWSWGAWGQT